MTTEIELLKHHPESIPELASIWHEVLGKIWVPDVTIERVIENFNNHKNDEKLPLTYVAFEDKMPVGMCSLRVNDGIRPDLTPWLGSLVVSSHHQKQGIGEKLINATKDKAKSLGFEKLYLFAFDPTISNYYERLGWSIIDTDKFKGHPVTVMEISFQS